MRKTFILTFTMVSSPSTVKIAFVFSAQNYSAVNFSLLFSSVRRFVRRGRRNYIELIKINEIETCCVIYLLNKFVIYSKNTEIPYTIVLFICRSRDVFCLSVLSPIVHEINHKNQLGCAHFKCESIPTSDRDQIESDQHEHFAGWTWKKQLSGSLIEC